MFECVCVCIYNEKEEKSTRFFFPSHIFYPSFSNMQLMTFERTKKKRETLDLLVTCFMNQKKNVLFIGYIDIEAYFLVLLYLWEIGKWKKKKENGIFLEGFIFQHIYISGFFVLFLSRNQKTLSLSLFDFFFFFSKDLFEWQW